MTRYYCLWCRRGVIAFRGRMAKSVGGAKRIEVLCPLCRRPNHIGFLRKYGVGVEEKLRVKA